MIHEMGCAMAQGFLMGRPSPAEVLESVTWPEMTDPAVGSLAG
jgi:EAL domain-containing protein (putative c-di-GMP-specific phosphodiesterase class I)